MAASKTQPGIIPVSALHGQPSKSADSMRERMIRAELKLTPDQRIVNALRLGIGESAESSGQG